MDKKRRITEGVFPPLKSSCLKIIIMYVCIVRVVGWFVCFVVVDVLFYIYIKMYICIVRVDCINSYVCFFL